MCSSGNVSSANENSVISSAKTKDFFRFGGLKIQVKLLENDYTFVKFSSKYASGQNILEMIGIRHYCHSPQ